MDQSAPSACPSIACRAAGGVLRANLATFSRDDPQTAMISAATLRSWRPQWLGWGRSGVV